MTPYKQGPPSEFREGEIKTGIARSFAAKTPSTASSPWPFEDSLRALATKTRMGRHVGAWWRRPQARKEHSSPTLPSPGGDTKPLTTGDPLPVWGTRQGTWLSHRGDLEPADACHAAGPSQPPCTPPSFVRFLATRNSQPATRHYIGTPCIPPS